MRRVFRHPKVLVCQVDKQPGEFFWQLLYAVHHRGVVAEDVMHICVGLRVQADAVGVQALLA